jgi:hypothetical protein
MVPIQEPFNKSSNYIAMEFRSLFQVLHFALHRYLLTVTDVKHFQKGSICYLNLIQLLQCAKHAYTYSTTSAQLEAYRKSVEGFLTLHNDLNPGSKGCKSTTGTVVVSQLLPFCERIDRNRRFSTDDLLFRKLIRRWTTDDRLFYKGIFISDREYVFDNNTNNGKLQVHEFQPSTLIRAFNQEWYLIVDPPDDRLIFIRNNSPKQRPNNIVINSTVVYFDINVEMPSNSRWSIGKFSCFKKGCMELLGNDGKCLRSFLPLKEDNYASTGLHPMKNNCVNWILFSSENPASLMLFPYSSRRRTYRSSISRRPL